MKRTVKETLQQAVGQLFVRIHGDLFPTICAGYKGDFEVTDLVYDSENLAHVSLVNLCKEKIGFEPLATNQDIFYSIMRIYSEGKKKSLGISQNPVP